MRVPNLFQSQADARRLYEMCLARLALQERHEDVLLVCRALRAHARRTTQGDKAGFSYGPEIEALCNLGRYRAAWQQWCRLQTLAAASGGHPDPVWSVLYYEAPLHFLNGRHSQALRQFESCLSQVVDVWSSYDLLHHVYNGVPAPRLTPEVCLHHCYAHFDRPLASWSHWQSFISGFPKRLFSMTGVSQGSLLESSSDFDTFVQRLAETAHRRRAGSGVSRGQRDLLESESKVRDAHVRIRDRIDAVASRPSPFQAILEQEFPSVFGPGAV